MRDRKNRKMFEQLNKRVSNRFLLRKLNEIKNGKGCSYFEAPMFVSSRNFSTINLATIEAGKRTGRSLFSMNRRAH